MDIKCLNIFLTPWCSVFIWSFIDLQNFLAFGGKVYCKPQVKELIAWLDVPTFKGK